MKIPLRTDEARTYLESKYKEKFTLVSASAPSLDQPHAELFFYSASHPNDPVKVYDDYRSFSDNYYAILIREKMQARIEDAARTTGENTLIGFRFRGSAMNAALSDPENFEADLAAHREYFAVNTLCSWMQRNRWTRPHFRAFWNSCLSAASLVR